MLTLHKVRAPGYATYLTAIEATGDYFVGPDGDPWASSGVWLGRLVGDFGLDDSAVTREALLALLEGKDPRTGKIIVRVARADRVRAHDLVFSAPSSVTAAWAVAEEPLRNAIQKAQDEAVAEAFAYMERHFQLVRRRDVGAMRGAVGALRQGLGRDPLSAEKRALKVPMVNESAGALLGAAFSHHTARQTAEQAKAGVPPDPQLHTHVLLLSLARRRDGALVAINSLELHCRRAELGAVYRALLAERLMRLGFAIDRRTGRNGKYFEIHGVPAELRGAWSNRHQEIANAVSTWRSEFRIAHGRDPTPVEERQWVVRSRTPKGRWFRGDLNRFWRTTAGHLGVTPESVEALRRGASLPATGKACAQLVGELLGKEGVTREHATFDVRLLRRDVYEHAPGLASPETVELAITEFLQCEEVVPVSSGSRERASWTTREMLALERRVLAWKEARAPSRVDEAVRRRLGVVSGIPSPSARLIEEAVLRSPMLLSKEQRAALDDILAHPSTFLSGEAGTGKGVVLRVAAHVWRKQGRRVFALAVGGAQAQRLAADMGEGVNAMPLDAFLRRVQFGHLVLGKSDVFVVDEASQVDTRRHEEFARCVGRMGTVVEIGDHAQLSSIGAGGLWPLLAKGGSRLQDVHRTTLPWEREAWAHLRRGESARALQLYARHRRLAVVATRREALDAAVVAWDRDGRDGLIITDASNAERHALNQLAQARRIQAGELGLKSVSVQTAEGSVTLHVGDAVVFTKQHRLVGAARVENGTTGVVVALEDGLFVRTNETAPREVEGSSACLDLHYAAHVIKCQGTTVRRSYVVAGGWQTHRESLYVSASRSQEGTWVFVDRESLEDDGAADALAELATRAHRSRAKVAAVTRCGAERPESLLLRQLPRIVAANVPRQERMVGSGA